MSSRALRRAQRELEEKQIQEKLAQEEQEDEQDDSEEEVIPKPKAKPSLFAMLGDDGDDQEEDEDDEVEQEQLQPEQKSDADAAPQPKPKKSKKKKKKGKSKAAAPESTKDTATDQASSGLDEIDQALLALSLSTNGQTTTDSNQHNTAISDEVKQLCAVLRVDTQYLHAANEMKKLFGRAALQNTDDEPQPRPRQRGHAQQGGIAAAVAGRNAPGRNLASIGLRRNIFIQGKEEWPRASSGGLGMEIAEKRSDGTIEYRFVHSRSYQEVQQQFQVCVGSMDPERMIQLLHFNRKRAIFSPYQYRY
jgi:hypothetical protein